MWATGGQRLDARRAVGEKVHQGIFGGHRKVVSGLIAAANPRRIKASHRRRGKVASAHRLYIMNNPLAGTDPTGYCAAETGTHIKTCVDVKVTMTDGSSQKFSVNTRSAGDMARAFNTPIPGLKGGDNGSRSAQGPTGAGSRQEQSATTSSKGSSANGAVSGAMQAVGASAGRVTLADKSSDEIERTDEAAAKLAPTITREANRALGNLIGKTYETLDEAAEIWAQRVRPVAAKYIAEIASRFFEVKGGYAFGSATSDGYIHEVDPTFGGSVHGAFYTRGYIHTHPSNRSFSENDLNWAHKMYLEAGGLHQSAYVVLESGRIDSWSTRSWATAPKAGSWSDYMKYTRRVK